MKTNKPLIIQLLVADMRHEQLVTGLKNLGFESDLHGTALSDVVAQMMGIAKAQTNTQWFDTYMNFLEKAGTYPLTGDGHNLMPLAGMCYEALESEQRTETVNREQ